MSVALITPCVLVWARERAYFTLEKLADSLKTTSDKVQLWEDGELKPTFKQAQTIAKLFQIPFGYLFLKEPPKDSLPIPDLRTFNNEPINELSPEFKMTLNDIILKQKWYKDYILENEGDEKYFLQQYTIKNTKESIIHNINQTLNLEKYIAKSLQKRIFLNKIIYEIEKLDILVMKNGIVGSNTQKSLKVSEFRGFAIYDRFAPLIFLNSKDTLSAQIFTLIHELVHLWIGESGISLLDFNHTDNDIELFCNEITANILVPNTLLNKYWDSSLNLEEHYTEMANIFSVSTLVILNKLYSLKYISYKDYIYYVEIEQNKFLEYSRIKPKNNGGSFYKTLKTRNGTNFSNALITSTLEGKTLYKDAANLLNTNFSNINKFAKELRIM
ncbi:MAG: XRE family transcriptional regulator [Campylobacterota bacterium]|nr:XRE family transcriptional regulator [Campylobacterota bacterium]